MLEKTVDKFLIRTCFTTNFSSRQPHRSPSNSSDLWWASQEHTQKKTQEIKQKMKESDRELEIPSNTQNDATTKIVSITKNSIFYLFSHIQNETLKSYTIWLNCDFRNKQIESKRGRERKRNIKIYFKREIESDMRGSQKRHAISHISGSRAFYELG